MPVREDGKWESWATRKARDKFEAEQAADEAFMPEPERVRKPKQQRRGKAAAEAAIAEATGTEVNLNPDADLIEAFGEGEDFTAESGDIQFEEQQ